MVLLRRRIGLVVEDRRMAGMGDEIGDVGALRQVAGMRGGGIEDDDHGAGGQLRHEVMRDRAHRSVRHRQHHDIGTDNSFGRINAVHAIGLLHALATGRADLDMARLETRPGQVAPKPHPHLSAGTEQCNDRHASLPIAACLSRPFGMQAD
jgi:hypothetical protein